MSDMAMAMAHKCTILGISGASASGKSLFARILCQELINNKNYDYSNSIGVIAADCYYRDQKKLTMEERTKVNYDHPNSMDHDLLFNHLQLLKTGKLINLPQYDYSQHTRKNETIFFHPHKLIIIEGILLLTDERLRNIMDLIIYVDTPLDICLVRRIKRDVSERGRTLDSVIEQYTKTVRPMFFQFIKPFKQCADIIIPHGENNAMMIDIIMAKIAKYCL